MLVLHVCILYIDVMCVSCGVVCVLVLRIFDCRRVELSTNVTLARSTWTSNYHIAPATGSSDQLERKCWNENHVPAEAGRPGLRLSSTGERERNTVIARRVGGQYVAVLFSLQLTSHTVKPFVTLSIM